MAETDENVEKQKQSNSTLSFDKTDNLNGGGELK